MSYDIERDRAFQHGMEEAARLLDEEAASAEKLCVEAANSGDSHTKMRMWAIRDHVLAMAQTVRTFAADKEWRDEVIAKNPNPSGHLDAEPSSAKAGTATSGLRNEDSGPVGLGPHALEATDIVAAIDAEIGEGWTAKLARCLAELKVNREGK